MSIDPFKIHTFVPLLTSQRPAGKQPVEAGAAFEQALAAAQASSPGQAEAVAEQAEAVLEMARLKLWQGLFVGDDEQAGATDLLAALAWQPSIEPQPHTGQTVDSLYTKLQPSLMENGKNNRSEIEQLIEWAAETVSLAPELIRSVVSVESDFQPTAVSTAGAQGLMQLMPATAEELGVKDSFDPQQNLLAGSRYLKQLLDKYDGDLDHALAAYNWGQGNVDRKGLEQMPQETRDYLAKVKGLLPVILSSAEDV